MRWLAATLTLGTLAAAPLGEARAGGMTYLALGDSITFGETDFAHNPSDGDRGYVGKYADGLAGQSGGVRPTVVNLAIDGETSSSFFSGVGRNGPAAGITDAALASWNTQYAGDPSASQNIRMIQAIGAAKAAGNDVGVVTVTMGANDLFQLVANPKFAAASAEKQQVMLAQTVGTVATNLGALLTEVKALAPMANITVVGDYNPFPATPTDPLNAIAAPAINALDGALQQVAGAFGAHYADTYTPFLGKESVYTYLTTMPGNVHPNDEGYAVIARQVEAAAVPEPSTLAVLGLGGLGLAVVARRRRG